MNRESVLAIIGGSGVYGFEGLKGIREHRIETPYGPPSSPIVEGELSGTRILFLARHGVDHSFVPSEVNYRANIHALKSLGAVWCLSVSAVGSLREELKPGMLVVPDQIIDRTRGREHSFFGRGVVAHVLLGDPFCPVLRESLGKCARQAAPGRATEGGTYVCIEGPAFSTRAESELYRSWGCSVVGMTAVPEAKLAREAEIAYAQLAMVTDYDCWRTGAEEVNTAQIISTLKENASLSKEVIKHLAQTIPSAVPSPIASRALENALVTPISKIRPDRLRELEPILRRYIEQ